MAVKRNDPPVDPHNRKTDQQAGKGAPPPPPPPPSGKKKSSYYQPVAQLVSVESGDEGQDYVGKPGSNVVAIGNATIDGVYHNIHGFGTMIVYTLTTGKYAGTKIYVGHAVEVDGLHKGQSVNGGDAIAVLNKAPGSLANTPGWVEVGVANDAGTAPKYQLPGDPHAPTTPGSLALKQVLGQALTPAEKSNVKAAQAQADANNAALIQSRAQLAGEEAVAKQTAHISDPWVTVVKDKNGNVRFGTGIGVNPPKNALTYAGQALTKSELSSVWGSRYADVFEQYTGRVPTASDIVGILGAGLSQYGLQSALAGGKMQSWKQFTKSPIYKQSAANYNSAAMGIIGGNAPKSLLQQAFANKWDQTALQQHLRNYVAPDGSRPYLKGPEFTNNSADMKSTYQGIYGAPDEAAMQSIKEAAGQGWTKEAFGQYLRSQPEYTSSVEYQSNAIDMLDNLGLLFKMAPVMKTVPQAKLPSGGTAVPNSALVPGAAGPLKPELNIAAGLAPVGGNK